MNDVPIQPDDETPLTGSHSSPVPTAATIAAGGIPGLSSDLQDAHAAVVSAAMEQLADLHTQVDLAKLDATGAITSTMGDAYGLLQDAQGGVLRASGKAISQANATLSDGETAIWEQGVRTPVTMEERVSDLEDQTGTAFANRFVVRPELAGGESLGPPAYDPLGRCWQCPVGYDLVYGTLTGDVICQSRADGSFVPAVGCADATAGGGGVGVSVPPISPPPPLGPPTPPINPPVSPPPIAPPLLPPPIVPGCGPVSGPAVMVGCTTLTPPPPKSYYWLTYERGLDCGCRICLWQGTTAPTGFAGVLWPGQWDTAPPQSVYDQIAAACGQPATGGIGPSGSPPTSPTSPPGSPPTSPPTSPPQSPIQTCDPFAVGGATPDTFDLMVDCSLTDLPSDNSAWGLARSCVATHDRYLSDVAAVAGTSASKLQGDKSASWWSVIGSVVGSSLDLAPFAPVMGATISAALTSRGEIIDKIMHPVQTTITELLKASSAGSLAHPEVVWPLGTYLAVGNRIETVTGFPMSYIQSNIRHLYQYANPMNIPSQAEVDGLWLSSHFGDDHWTCYTRANGNIPSLARAVRDAKTVRPGPRDVVDLYRRGKIKTSDAFVRRMREDGVTQAHHVQDFFDLSEQLPHQDDLVRFMVRDVFDPQVVQRLKLDDEFASKWTADAKDYGTKTGVGDDLMKLQWMAHWRIPSDTHLYQMAHRLRPDRKEVLVWDASAKVFGKEGTEAKLGPRPPVFTLDDLSYVLKVNDNLPNYVPHLVSIAYHPITVTDGRRAFQIGFYDEAQLKTVFLDNGYSPTDADGQVNYEAALKRQRISNVSGVWTVRKAVKAYKSGTIDKDTCIDLITPIVQDDPTVQRIVKGADLEVVADVREQQLRAIRRRYVMGEFDWLAARDRLRLVGVANARLLDLFTDWEARRMDHAKEPRVTMLCQWLEMGIINLDQYADRLTRLGYGEEDRTRIINTCAVQNAAKAAKARATAASKVAADLERQNRGVRREILEELDLAKTQLTVYKQALTQAQTELAKLKAEVESQKLHA